MSTVLHPQDLAWILARLNAKVKAELKASCGNVFLAGGFIRSMITKEPVADVDLIASSKEAAQALALRFSIGCNLPVHQTPNAFTLRGYDPAVQIIHRWTFDNPQSAIDSFDFTIAKAAIWFDGDYWRSVCHPDYYADVAAKRLVYTNPIRDEEPGGSMLRVLKFYQRGYRIPLDSLAQVIDRLVSTVNFDNTGGLSSAEVICGLLREVDPAIDPAHTAHLPPAGETVPLEDTL